MYYQILRHRWTSPTTDQSKLQVSSLCYEEGLSNQNGRQPNGQFQVSSKRLPSQETKRVSDMAPDLSLNTHHATDSQHNFVSNAHYLRSSAQDWRAVLLFEALCCILFSTKHKYNSKRNCKYILVTK
jgi:hypothetical protein